MKALLLSAALAAAAPVAGDEIVAVTSRPGGRIGLHREAGEVKFRAANFVVRSALELARPAVLPVYLVGTSRGTISAALLGRVAETAAAIAAWMLHPPFPTDLE